MPNGMSRCGFFASCAVVDTASKPMYAKKMIAPPRITPLHPNSPNVPVLAGTNGVQFDGMMNQTAPITIAITTPTLIATMIVLIDADSRMPTTSSAVTAITSRIAGRLTIAVTGSPPGTATSVPGAALSAAGNGIPRSRNRLVRCPDQPTETVAALSAYSSTRSHPMIQAISSPSVA